MFRSTFSPRSRRGGLLVGALAALAMPGAPLFGEGNGEAPSPPVAGEPQQPPATQLAANGNPQQGAVAPDQNRGAVAPDQNRGAVAPDQNRQSGAGATGRSPSGAGRSQSGAGATGRNGALDNRFQGNGVGNRGGALGLGLGVQRPNFGDRSRRAALEQALGRDARFQSLSPIELQRAIDALLNNRREQIRSYYEMRELRDRAVNDQADRVTHEEAKELAKKKAPDRLGKQHFYEMTGKLFWPDPLGAEVLEPYTAPIDNRFQKRANAESQYTAEDAAVVQRMVGLLQDAIETLQDDLSPEDYSRLTRYLDRVAYESRFNAQGERVDLPESRDREERTGGGQDRQGQDSGRSQERSRLDI